jgi:glycosyltransferase involved in cell wall biosynthesis
VVVHFEGVTAGTDLASGVKRYQVENRAKFAAKWADALLRQDPPPHLSGAAPETADRARLGRRAAEPASDGRRVLVVDPFMPLHDRASGSLRLFRLLQLMREQGCRVTYVGRAGVGQERYRRELEAMGIEAYAGDPDRMLACGYRIDAPRVDLPALLRERRFEVAWLSFWYIGEQYLPLVRAHSPSTRILLDSVDVHFLRERRQAELEGTLGERAAELAERRRRELSVYAAADGVVTVTPEDGAALRAEGVRTPLAVIPNVHDRAGGDPAGFDARGGLVFVGNFAHAPNVDAVRWLCADVLPRVRRRLPEVGLTVVGASPPEEVRALAGQGVTVTGHVPEVAPYLDAARVSVAPLRYGAGMKGKIGEALGRGLPVVTTSIGAEGMGLVHGEHALVADDPAALAEALVQALTDGALWARLSGAGRAHVEARYGRAVVGRALAELLGRGAPAPGPAAVDAGRPGLQERARA